MKVMRKFLLIMSYCIVLAGCGSTTGYRITGMIPGMQDGVKVYLEMIDEDSAEKIDSTIVLGEKFVLESTKSLSCPRMAMLIYNLTPDEQNQRKVELRRTVLFLSDGVELHCTCPVDSLPSCYFSPKIQDHNVLITGSLDVDLYMDYLRQTTNSSPTKVCARNDYLDAYKKVETGEITLHEVMEMVRERDKTVKELNDRILRFLKTHGNSIVAVDGLIWLLDANPSCFTLKEINQYIEMIAPQLLETPLGKRLQIAIERAKACAKGELYKDIELTNLEGKKVKLSEYILPGQCNMLEFWASWCAPCRGEIPHLRHIYELCEDGNFNMISISLDQKETDWKKAVQEENMIWAQLNDPLGFEGPVRKDYRVNGVPFCLILDKEGRIVCAGVRKVELDVALSDLLGDKLKI